ncbi:MAG: hypothetical protein P8N43_00705, partial [Alphaproteobacteria bacterium]|nr:hypothetical protein [Alphaproteobacteria bacterium]
VQGTLIQFQCRPAQSIMLLLLAVQELVWQWLERLMKYQLLLLDLMWIIVMVVHLYYPDLLL